MAFETILLSDEEKNNIFPYKNLLIFLIILRDVFDNYINYRQYRRLGENRPIPKELIPMGFNQEKHEESNKYSKAKLKYQIISQFFQNVIDLLFIYFELFPLEYNISKKLCQYIPLIKFNPQNEYGPLTVIVFMELIREEIKSLPFEVYMTFVIEEKFGFNKTTVSTFIKDQIKTFILYLIFLPPLLSLLVYIIIKGGKYFYIFVEIFVIILLFLFMWIYPNFIQPLFNKFKDLEEGDLKKQIFELANRVNYPLTKIYEMDESERSSHSNAYLFGFGKNKRIVLYDTLIKNLKPNEIVGTLAHELGHWKKWHSIFNFSFAFSYIFILFYLFQFFMNEEKIFISFGFEEKSVFIGLFIYFLMISVIMYFINFLQMFMTRHFEYQADNFGCELGYGEELKSALTKLTEENKSNLDPDPYFSMFNYTHPTLVERIKEINKYKEINNKKEN